MLALFLMGIIPIVAFAIVDTFASLRTAILSALALGLIEVILSIVWTGGLDWISVGVFGLLLLFGLISIRMSTPTAFKLQPAVVSGLMGLVFCLSYLFHHSLFVLIFDKYQELLLSIEAFQNFVNIYGLEKTRELMNQYTLLAGVSFLLHALLMLWSALKLSKWWWVLFKAIGIYIIIFIVGIIYNLMGWGQI